MVAARPGVPSAWSAQLERTRGPKHSTAVVTCRRSGDNRGGWRWEWRDTPGVPGVGGVSCVGAQCSTVVPS